MHNYGPADVWLQGDFITRGIVVFLALMSIASWVVILIKTMGLLRARAMSKVAYRAFWAASGFEAGIDALGAAIHNPYRQLALTAREANEQQSDAQQLLHGSMSNGEWVSRCLHNMLDEQLAQMQTGLAVLASIGSTAPFVGLFGTVWGIYHALMAIGISGQSSLDHVAGPVGESLIMTAAGLFVAIPAVLGYNALSRGNKGVGRKMVRFTHELHAYFVTGGKHRQEKKSTGMPAVELNHSRVKTA